MTTTTEWLPEYTVGNSKMDYQHMLLLTICKEISELSKKQNTAFTSHFHLVLNDLINYAKNHFSVEESLLNEINYPELDEQKREHAEYLETVTNLIEGAMAGKLDIEKLNEFAEAWWINHILTSDMKYKPYFKNQN